MYGGLRCAFLTEKVLLCHVTLDMNRVLSLFTDLEYNVQNTDSQIHIKQKSNKIAFLLCSEAKNQGILHKLKLSSHFEINHTIFL